MITLEDKVAIVTGASRGIGAEIARQAAKAGAKVVVSSRKIEPLTEVAQQIEEAGGEALPFACHTGKPEQIEALVEAAAERFGKVDVLINNAATNPYFGPMMNIEDWAWDKTFEVNVRGYFQMTREVVRHIQKRKGTGSIVNIASVASFMAMPLQGVYAMTKAAVASMTKTLSVELGPDVRVNAVAPGLVDTKFASALTENDEILADVLKRTSLKRVGTPEDIAGIVLLLASDQGAYFNGAVVTCDGGWSLG